jgi:hypothetical protein
VEEYTERGSSWTTIIIHSQRHRRIIVINSAPVIKKNREDITLEVANGSLSNLTRVRDPEFRKLRREINPKRDSPSRVRDDLLTKL